MNQRKVEAQQIRLNRMQASIEARQKLLKERGLDEKQMGREPTLRHLLAESRKIKRTIETLRWEPPKVEQAAIPGKGEKAEKPKKGEKAEKGDKAAKEATAQKPPKPPKEKKPKPKEPKPEE